MTIFEYRKYASWNGIKGNTNSMEIRIMDEGKLEFEETDFENNALKYENYDVSENTINKIKSLINENNNIFEVNSFLDNGSEDGYGNEFIFCTEKRNRQILAWNIELCEENKDEDENNCNQEKIVLNLFKEICNCLKKDGITLGLYEFNKN